MKVTFEMREQYRDNVHRILNGRGPVVRGSSAQQGAALRLSAMLDSGFDALLVRDKKRLAICERAVRILEEHGNTRGKSAGVRKYLEIFREEADIEQKKKNKTEEERSKRKQLLVERATSGGATDSYKLAKRLGEDSEATFWFLKAAKLGHIESQFLVGILYFNGIGGVEKDFSAAMEWFSKAADQGHVRAKEYVKYLEPKLDELEEKRRISQGASWPNGSAGKAFSGDVHIDEGDWRKLSPLTAMGYHVGRTAGVSDAKRRDILMHILYGALCFPEGFSDEEREGWGEPGSAPRLQKIVTHIKQNICLRRNLQNMEDAVDDWESDLEWFERQF
jgi:hypothetical protein